MASLTTTSVSVTQSHVPLTAGTSVSCETTSRLSSVKLSVRRRPVSIGHGHLSWTNSQSLGKTISLFVPTTSQTAEVGPSEASSQVMAFTQEQSKLVKESWKLVQKDDPGKWALKFFLKVFEIAPSVKRMFSFLKDPKYPQIEKNPKLKGHALQVFALTGQAATQLGDKGGLDSLIPRLMELGDKHVTYGVVDEHFDVVKFALLTTLGEALPEQWTPEMKEAWSTAYDEVVRNITAEMELVRARGPAEQARVAK